MVLIAEATYEPGMCLVPRPPSQHGMLVMRHAVAEYYTSEPSPAQWVAIGTVVPRGECGSGVVPRAFLVGCGVTQDDAVEDLRRRLIELRFDAECASVH